MRRATVAFLAVLVAITIVGGTTACSDHETTPADTTPSTATVRFVDGELRPRTVEVAAGGSVTWVNDDVTDHQLLSLEPGVIESDYLRPGDSWTATFTVPGEFRYYDDIRNTVKGTLIVR